MHILARPSGRIDGGDDAIDLGQSPADIIVLSAADTEISAFADAAKHLHATKEGGDVTLRLANLMSLAHPFSVDTYVDQTVQGSKLVLLRLLGGVGYWPYGLERLVEAARGYGVLLAVTPGDDRWDEGLEGYSTVDVEVAKQLWRYCVEGGAGNIGNALRYAAHILGKGEAPAPPRPLPRAGIYLPGRRDAGLSDLESTWPQADRPRAAVVFYRALVQSGQTAPVDAVIDGVQRRGLNAVPVFVASLKDPECRAVVETLFSEKPPAVVLNATAFALSKAGEEHRPTILDRWGAPVLQMVFSSSSEEGWRESDQGLGARDLAMHVVLPEVDGRILARAVSFKEQCAFDETIQAAPMRFVPKPDRVEFVAALAARWAALAAMPNRDKRAALILANYPNKDGRLANGVGLDTPASCAALLQAMKLDGYEVSDAPENASGLMTLLMGGVTNALEGRGERITTEALTLEAYDAHFQTLPEETRAKVISRWGAPENDPHVEAGAFQLAVHRFGNVVVGVQPARGYNIDPKETYHDPDLAPPHHYFAFYIWLREVFRVNAFVHLGKHGNLEWLPGKALALSQACFPEAILGPVPNIYPFIVNDPGEGAQAKRRTSAVIVDHLTPPMTRAESYGVAGQLETLLDEYYLAAGVDPRRTAALTRDILDLSAREGLDLDVGLSADMDEMTRLARIDAHLCDLKELQIRDGLHILGSAPQGEQLTDLLVALARTPRGGEAKDASLLRALADDFEWGEFDPLECDFAAPWAYSRPEVLTGLTTAAWRSNGDAVERLEIYAQSLVAGDLAPPQSFHATMAVLAEINNRLRPAVIKSGAAEIDAVLTGLNGGFVPPGPSGAPTRGRPDVLPTGRNFYSVDVRAVPTQVSWRIGSLSAERLLERHFQDEGVYPEAIVLTCWGTANMRTGGDDIAQALALIGARPRWEGNSGRVTGFEILSLSELKRPRVDVTLRVSGFFRDAFPHQMDLFQSAVLKISQLDEPESANPLSARVRREAEEMITQGALEEEAFRRSAFRVFGSRPGAYGAGLQALIDEKIWNDRSDFADAFLTWGSYAYGAGAQGEQARDGLETRLRKVDAVVHNQDNREHDLLDSDDYYQFEGGLAATVESLRGSAPQVYHNDHSRPERPVIRTLEEEIGRVVRARAGNPKWIAGVMRHGYKGAFEIAATVDYLFAFAATTRAVKDHHFDQLLAAYLENDEVRGFLENSNPAALREIVERFCEAIDRDIWRPRKNSVHDFLKALNTGAMQDE